MVDSHELDGSWLKLGTTPVGNFFINSSNTSATNLKECDAKVLGSGFVSQLFATTPTDDQRLANCEMSTHDITVAAGQTKIQSQLPVIVNLQALKAEEVIKVLTQVM